MIEKLRLENFKSHKDTEIDFGKVTFLCGQNGIGKSSIIQSLLLLRQTFLKNRLDKILTLNNPLCYIGTGNDALHQYAENDNLSFTFSENNILNKWIFNVKNRDKDYILLDETHIPITADLTQFALFNTQFQYISAGRQADYKSDDYVVETEKQLSIEEGKAELTAHFLFKYQNLKVNEKLLHPNNTEENNKDLLHHVTLWQREISKGVNVIPEKIGTNYEVSYSFAKENGESTQKFNAKNVGFGLSYTLPIVVAILSAEPNSLILIENPEAHLHPYAQAKIVELICLASQIGIQIVVETHSDHIINGALVACKKGKIHYNDIKIWYFDRDENQHKAITTEIEVKEGGKITYPPIGFFDQISKDRKVLMGF